MVTDRLAAVRLAGRALWERRGQTLLIILIAALVNGTVVFAAGYQRQVQETVVDATFATDGPGSAWMLRGSSTSNPGAALPDGWDALFEPPVAGQVAPLSWVTPRYPLGIGGVLSTRSDICAHLVFVTGHCPTGTDEVAVSAADADRFGIRAGQRVRVQSSISTPVSVTVVAIYRPRDQAEGYWFGNPPTGSSGFDTRDQPRSNPLITVGDVAADVPGAQRTLDLRLDRAVADVDRLPAIREATATLVSTAPRDGIILTTGIPQSLARIAAERVRAAAGLSLTMAQLTALVVVVVALLASVAIAAERGELGLARLRGLSGRRAGRQTIGRWALAVSLGWLLGWLPAMAALWYVAARLPDGTVPVVAFVPLAAGAALLLMIAAIVPATRTLVRRPVIELLRTSSPAAHDRVLRELVVDVAVIVAAASGLLVALQSGASSLLGLLVPSLLAVAIGIALGRLVTWLADRARRRRTRTGDRAGGLLTAILVGRLRGVRLAMVTVSLTTAFVVFAVQVQTIGSTVRLHEAEVRTGATAVLTVDGEPSDLLHALDELDPSHATDRATMTAVVVTRRADATATRGMFVEPAAFAALAFGAERAAGPGDWQRIAAPTTRPVDLSGDTLSLTIGPHGALGGTADGDPARVGRRAVVGLGYLDAAGTRRTLNLGTITLDRSGAQSLRRPIECTASCRLLQLTVAPDGPMRGALPVTALAVGPGLGSGSSGSGSSGSVSVARSVDLGSASDWTQAPTVGPGAEVAARPGDPGLVLAVSSGGGQVAVQQAWAPAVLPVLTAEDVRLGVAPTIAAPGGTPVAVDAVARAQDAIPRELAGVAVADLEAARRNGYLTATPETSVQVWLSAAASERVDAISAELAGRGLQVTSVDRLDTALAAQRLTAAALTGAVTPLLAALALVFGSLAIALTAAGQREVLGRDLAALRLAGVADRVLRRALLRTYVWPVLVAVLAGVLAGTIGCLLVAGALPVLPDRSSAIHPDLSLRLPALALSVLGCLGVLVAVAAGSAVLILGRSRESPGSPVHRQGGRR